MLFFIGLFFLPLFNRPALAACDLPTVPLSVSNPSPNGTQEFTITVSWNQLNAEEFKKWQGQRYGVKIYEGDKIIAVVTMPNENVTDASAQTSNPLSRLSNLQPGEHKLAATLTLGVADGCQYGSAPFTYGTAVSPTPTPGPSCKLPDLCEKNSDCQDGTPQCATYTCEGIGIDPNFPKQGVCSNTAVTPTPAAGPTQLKYGDLCGMSIGSGTAQCPPGTQCQRVSPEKTNSAERCGGQKAELVLARCNTSLDLKTVDVCYPYSDSSVKPGETITNALACGGGTSGYVCEDPEAYFCMVRDTSDPTEADLRCQKIPNKKSPCLEGLMEDGRPAPKDKPALIAKCTKFATAVGELQTTPMAFMQKLFGIILSLAGGIALLLIIFSGYQILTSQGNPEKIQGAKDTITSAIIGLVFMIFSMVILQVIGVDILHIPILNGGVRTATPTPGPLPPGEAT